MSAWMRRGASIDDSIQRFLRYKSVDCREATVLRLADALRSFRRFIDSEGGKLRRVAQIGPADVQDWQQWRRTESTARHKGRPPAARTVNTELVMIRQWLGWLVTREEIPSNPASGVKKLRFVDDSERKALDRDEWQGLVRASLELEIAHPARRGQTRIFRFLVSTGLRIGELTHLEWSDVTADLILIRPKRGWTPKTYAREIPLTDEVRRLLSGIRRVGRLVFVDYRGKPIKPQRVRTWLIRAAKRAGVEGVTGPHTLRHTCLTWLSNDPDVPISHVQLIAGHTTLETTQLYLHPSKRDLARSMEKLRVG